MASDPCSPDLLLSSVTYGSLLTNCYKFLIREKAIVVPSSPEGVLGESCHGVMRRTLLCVISLKDPPGLTYPTAKTSLVIVTKKMDGTTSRTYTMTNMRAFDFGEKVFDKEAPEQSFFEQAFYNESDFSVYPLAIT